MTATSSTVPPTSSDQPTFHWSEAEIRRVGYRVADLIADYLLGLERGPVFCPVPRDLAERLVATPPPQTGTSPDALLEEFLRDVAPYPFGNGHRRFFGWVNSPPTAIAIFGSALAAAMNPSVAGGNHAAVYLEHQVINWFKALLGFPVESTGVLVSGTSQGALTALGVARHRACVRRGWNVRAAGMQGLPAHLVVYGTGEGHSCHQKALELLGIGSENLRTVPTDAALRMDPRALDSMIVGDLEAGRVPLAVIASAGTVNTGVIDPLASVADVCSRHDVWLHVDGAYGGPAILTEEYAPELAPIRHADSVALDPHKWLYVPVDAGVVLVRDAAVMRDAYSLVPPYLRTDGDPTGVQGPPWFSEYSVEQTRPFRALKVWLSLRHFGLDGYRSLLSHDIGTGRYLAQQLRLANDFEIWEPQTLSIICFRYSPAHLRDDPRAIDELNRAVLTDVQLGGEAFVSSTLLRDRFWLRACIVNPMAGESDMEALVGIVRTAGQRRT
ncbi:MAG TPA: pyridoxal-dependent decarboxylase [Gemmatimonadales bacterium]|nr:pyridoxal-dependent decarboxylase [Gemmatimonadales bacterium]